MLIIKEEVTLSELDEAISYIATQLKVDKYGDRMDWRKEKLLRESIDDLLDARLDLIAKVSGVGAE